MVMAVRGLGRGLEKGALVTGDVYVARGPKNAFLMLAGPETDDTLDTVLAFEGAVFDDTPPPYQIYRSAVPGVPAVVDGEVEIRPLEGRQPFVALDDQTGSGLAVAPDGVPWVRLRGGQWLNLHKGTVESLRPANAAVYSQWRIVWRDGAKLETLATFGETAPNNNPG